ncbi:hypothetical protein BDY24DRAFT_65622 [Mrakia frigida]|uniref:uncharacterized protein n=1 Tax=Mrakia frigida TaxID=29902 RepID=UPI003FCC2660
MSWIEPPTYTSTTSAISTSTSAGVESVSILLAPVEGRSTFLRGRLGRGRKQAKVEGEVMIKGISSRVLALSVSLSLLSTTSEESSPVTLFNRSHSLHPFLPEPSSSSSSSSFLTPSSSSPRPPPFRPTQRFSIPIPSTLPQCLHQSTMNLTYHLTATLTVASSSSESSPSPTSSLPLPRQPSTTHVETMEIHLCPSGPSIEEIEEGDVHPALVEIPLPISSTPVKVGFAKTRVRKSETIGVWVEIPVPQPGTLERGISLRNVRAEMHRVVSVEGAEKASTSSSNSNGRSLGVASSSASTLLTSTGASCRFSPISPIRLRLSLHPPLSPSSAYQLSCGHLSQSTRNLVGRDDGKALETRFFVKVFIGLAPEEVEIEKEIEVLGDLDLEDDTSVDGGESLEEEDASESTEVPPPVPPEPSFPPSKERRWEGETFRASSSGSVGEGASGSGGDPPPFVASDPFPSVVGSNPPSIHLNLDTLTSSASPPSDSPPPMSPINNELTSPSQPPPFSELPPPPPSFQPLTSHHHHRSPSAPPPTFLESEASSSSSSISSLNLGPPIPPFPFNTQPSSVARSSAVVLRPSPLNAPSALPPPIHQPESSTSTNPASLPPSWIEYDGYEQFSDPPPPLSISFSTTSSVDPPREGEISSLAVEQMEEMIHSLTIESGAGTGGGGAALAGAGASSSARVDDPNDLPPTFGALEAGRRSASGLAAGEGSSGSGGVGVGSSGPGGVDGRRGGGGGGAQGEGAALPPSYAGDGMEGGMTQQEEPPQYS